MTAMMMMPPHESKEDGAASAAPYSPTNFSPPDRPTSAPKTPLYTDEYIDRGFRRTCPPAQLIPLFPHRALRAWPNDGAQPVLYLPIERVLTERFSTDSHFSAFSLPDYPYRLRRDAYAHTGGLYPVMALVVFDIDSDTAHKTHRVASDDWFAREKEKVYRLLVQHPGAFVYRTRGGYRIIYRALEGIIIGSEEAEYAWRLGYVRSGTYLAERFDIVIDPTCKSWVWTFRSPHATRDRGGPPENRETFGDPSAIGTWIYEPQ
jgi:hypothetical protein